MVMCVVDRISFSGKSTYNYKNVQYFVIFLEKSFLITEYCPKGSLQDILEDDEFELDNDFKWVDAECAVWHRLSVCAR